MSSVITNLEVEYPESDGKPMGETDLHRMWMIRIYDILKWRYRDQRVYVGSDLLVYYTEGIPRHLIVPDVFVVINSEPGPRRVYKVWEEGAPPQVVFEVTSRRTRREDRTDKPGIYGRIGVEELLLFDPTSDYLKPQLQGFRFENGEPVQLGRDEAGALHSRVLGLRLAQQGRSLEMFDAQTGARQLTEAEAEREAKETAEAELKRLRAELERLRRDAN